MKTGRSPYGVFDAFADDAGGDAHLSGKVARALMEQTPDLFVQQPGIYKTEMLAVKGR